jgi:tetratricopeptide (TPR) repeat protein
LNGPLHPRTLEERGYLCKSLLDYGDFDAALGECGEAARVAEENASENAYLLGKIMLYTGVTLREAHDYDGARRAFDRAKGNAEVESDVVGEVALLEAATGHPDEAIAFLRESLEDAEKSLPPGHPNVLGSKLELGDALLDDTRHDESRKEARAILDDAKDTLAIAEVSPLLAADVKFADARAIGADSDEARALAHEAREAYAALAPKTKRYDDALAEMDAWLALADHAPRD